MDSKVFLSKIREIIREEIEYALSKKNNTKNEQTEALLHGIRMIKESQNNKKPIKYKDTKFNSIQDILNETKKTLQESVDLENDFKFTSDMIQNNNHAAIPNGISSEHIPDEVMSALTRDYSSLMKKIDEKKGR
jgi:viroplasmin and RNaseH domain-containing protein